MLLECSRAVRIGGNVRGGVSDARVRTVKVESGTCNHQDREPYGPTKHKELVQHLEFRECWQQLELRERPEHRQRRLDPVHR